MFENIRLEFEVKGNDFNSAGEASSIVKRTLRDNNIDERFVRRAAIAMYEAEINMVIHANGGQVIAEVTEEYLRAIFIDTGPGIQDIELAMQEGQSTASDKAREMGFGAGLGLPNIKKNTDKLQIISEVGKGTTVVIEIYFK